MNLAVFFWFTFGVVAAFIAGWLEGPRFWVWVKTLFRKEVVAVEEKLGPTGPTGG